MTIAELIDEIAERAGRPLGEFKSYLLTTAREQAEAHDAAAAALQARNRALEEENANLKAHIKEQDIHLQRRKPPPEDYGTPYINMTEDL